MRSTPSACAATAASCSSIPTRTASSRSCWRTARRRGQVLPARALERCADRRGAPLRARAGRGRGAGGAALRCCDRCSPDVRLLPGDPPATLLAAARRPALRGCAALRRPRAGAGRRRRAGAPGRLHRPAARRRRSPAFAHRRTHERPRDARARVALLLDGDFVSDGQRPAGPTPAPRPPSCIDAAFARIRPQSIRLHGDCHPATCCGATPAPTWSTWTTPAWARPCRTCGCCCRASPRRWRAAAPAAARLRAFMDFDRRELR
jgi:hypothetical protein